MALVLADRVRETTTTAGTGTITLLGAVPSCQSFAVVGNGNTTYYTIVAYTGTEYEVGIGTYTSSGTTLSRDTVLASSNGGSLVNFSAGTKDVFVDYPAGRAVYEDAAGNVDGYPITGGTINNTVIGGTTPAAGTFTTLTAQNETLKGTGNNFFNYSQDYTQSAWSKVGSTITAASTTAPDGTSTGQTLNEDTSTGQHNINRGGSSETLVIGATYTMSVYAKQSGRSIIFIQSLITFTKSYFDIASGTVLSSGSGMTSTITSVGNGWYRCAVTFVCDSTNNSIRVIAATTGNGVQTYTGTGIASVFLWGAQLELGSTANTYIPTTAAAVYGTPTLSFSGVASIGLQSDGSLYETSAGTGNVRFYTNNIGQEQARVSHTASAVNYHQLTGSATGSGPIHSVAGSDTNIDLNLTPKGTGNVVANVNSGTFTIGRDSASNSIKLTAPNQNLYIQSTGGGSILFNTADTILNQMRITSTTAAVNYANITGGATGSGVTLSAQGSDTNIDLNLTSKGSGNVNLNTGGGTQFSVANTASATNYFATTGSNGGTPALYSAGASTNIGANFVSKGTGSLAFYTNGSVAQAAITHTASAVNYVQMTGATTTTNPVITGQGSDSEVGLDLGIRTGGFNYIRQRIGSTGFIDFSLNAAGSPALKTNIAGSQVNYLQIVGSATGFGPVLSAQGSDTNIPLVLQPKGTGALQAQQTDSTATGGNARGANAVDWQTFTRSSATQVASGLASSILGGARNTSSSIASVVVGGTDNTASANSSFIGTGNGNIASGTSSGIVSGINNTNSGIFAFIGAGQANTNAGYLGVVVGGAVNSGTSGSAVTTQSGTMNGTTAVTLSGSNANIKVGQLIQGTSIVSASGVTPYTYVAAISGTSLTLSQAASGSSTSTLSFYTPHGVVVGGGNNQATGSYSFIGGGGDAGTAANRNVASGDWSTVAGGQKNVASANYAAVAGGTNNTASGVGAFIGGGGFDGATISANAVSGLSAVVSGGMGNSASGYNAVVSGGRQNLANSTAGTVTGGGYGTSRGITGYTVSPASFSPIGTFLVGTSQAALLVLGKQTTNATATVITSDGSAASGTNQVILPPNSAYAFRGTVIANVTGAANGASWSFEGAIMQGANAASTVLMGTPAINRVAATAGATAWAIALTADTTNGGLAVTVTGAASTTIRWVCKAETCEVTF